MPWILGSFTMLVCSHPGTGTVVAKASHGLRSNRSWKGHLHLVVFIRQQSVPTFGGGPDTRHQRLLPCLWPTSGGYWKDADVLGPNKRKPIHIAHLVYLRGFRSVSEARPGCSWYFL